MSEDVKKPIDDSAQNSTEALAFPNEIPKDVTWTPEADMLMQISESTNVIADAAISIDHSLRGILVLLTQAADIAGEYLSQKVIDND